jgi:hypothetical protein
MLPSRAAFGDDPPERLLKGNLHCIGRLTIDAQLYVHESTPGERCGDLQIELIQPIELPLRACEEDGRLHAAEFDGHLIQPAAKPQPRAKEHQKQPLACRAHFERYGQKAILLRIELCNGEKDLFTIGLHLNGKSGGNTLAAGIGSEEAGRHIIDLQRARRGNFIAIEHGDGRAAFGQPGGQQVVDLLWRDKEELGEPFGACAVRDFDRDPCQPRLVPKAATIISGAKLSARKLAAETLATAGNAAIVSEYACVPLHVLDEVARIVKLKVPALVGVPAKTPEAAAKLKPGGKAPSLTVKLNVPPHVAISVC